MGAKSTDVPMVLNANVEPRERAIDRRGAIMGPPMSWEMEQYLTRPNEPTPPTDPRAATVFELTCMGWRQSRIADVLGLSTRTVRRLLREAENAYGQRARAVNCVRKKR